MRLLKGVLVACVLAVLWSCVVVPVADESYPRPPAPPPPSERPLVQIVDLEALPARFAPGRPIDFVVRLGNSGGRGYGFDLGVFHENRLVGWINGIEVPRGESNFRLKDDRFSGEPGSYIVRLRYRERIVEERRFSAWPSGDGRFVIDPGQAPREPRPSVEIDNLEAAPSVFSPGQPIDFVVTIENKQEARPGFDIGVFYEGRLVGWQQNKVLRQGINHFKLRDPGFTGDPGSYIVKVRYGADVISEKRFITNRTRDGRYTIDPRHVSAGREESRVSIVNLEASPVRFVARMPIDFMVRIDNPGPAVSGIDVGIFHEGRLVGWDMDKVLNRGTNTFRVRDNGFTGESGRYIVRVRRGGRIIDEKDFATRKLSPYGFTIDPLYDGKDDGGRPRQR